VTSEDATTLFHLRCLWHGIYTISVTDGIWVARRRDNPTRLFTADTAPELRWLLRADYRQSARSCGSPLASS
jgi:hypothetical protein